MGIVYESSDIWQLVRYHIDFKITIYLRVCEYDCADKKLNIVVEKLRKIVKIRELPYNFWYSSSLISFVKSVSQFP